MPPPLVLIHGMWATPSVWDNYKPVLEAAGYEVHTPALRHHDVDPKGPPPEALGTTSLTDYVDDLAALIETLPATPILIGHSMGGLLAQLLAARGLAAAAVLLTPAPPAGLPNFYPSVIAAFWPVLTTWKFWQKPHGRSFAHARRTVFVHLSEQQARELYDQGVWESGRAIAEIGLWYLDPKRAAKVPAEKVSCPLLVVAGRHDGITPPGLVRKIASRYGDRATYLELPNHAHWVLGEPGWQIVVEDILCWLKQQEFYPGGIYH